jgi:hypothetical protein
VSAWVVIFESDGAEAPLYVGPFASLDNAERFAAAHEAVTVALLDPPEDYAL